ncbi:hypothetical protein PENSOL_c032G09820 [Penicillium solitum]|uniref:Carboxy-cis,cis-muconate cyclase n=1 Tax=Penicillium solitum TaxID=60172 RepID=A0A1V6QW89_9EURO|nr:uncharacterized protein PENSOL_c032G09820 [Penicillium solitum]OQD93455.1 hypothetical protein PENSOL_c032G09820 [Penicillium solitum]
MRSALITFVLIQLARSVAGGKHHFFTGAFTGSDVFLMEFDDLSDKLTLLANESTVGDTTKWISFDAQKKNLYVAQDSFYGSYAIGSNLTLTYKSQINLTEDCQNANFIVGSLQAPRFREGSLKAVTANITYNTNAGVHGLAVSAKGNFIYSADDSGDAVWVHSYDNTTQTLTKVQRVSAPTGANPRHLAVHPKGLYVYVVFEETTALGIYRRNPTTGRLTYTNQTYSLIPSPFTNTSSYWADEVAFSTFEGSGSVPKYLLASTRSRSTTEKGYVTVFTLDPESGSIEEKLLQLPTTGSGGTANSVSPAPFSGDYFAITDSGSDFVEIWKIKNRTAEAVAHLDLSVGPANVAWYS